MAPPAHVAWAAPAGSAAPDAGARARGRGPACSSRHAGTRSAVHRSNVEGTRRTPCTLLARRLELARALRWPVRMHVRFEARGVGSELELQPGTWTVGGAEDDGVRFPGLPPRLLELELQADRAWLRCTRPLRVGRAVLEPGIRRWLLPGEVVRLSRHALLSVAPPSGPAGTLALVRSLLELGSTPLCSAAPALVCVAGADAGAVFLLAGPAVELGRSPTCAVQLGDGAVSRRHLQLMRDPGGAHRVRDLGSRNRTRCNGRLLRSSRLLVDGDVLAVGRSQLHYRRESPEPCRSADEGEREQRPDAVSASGTGPPAPPAAP
jgi:Inner membrane component of T3SS, cytoplasmic domain